MSELVLTLGAGADRYKFRDIVTFEMTRDIEEICSGFVIEVLDLARVAAALPSWWQPTPKQRPLAPGLRAEIAIDGEVVLVGWVDAVKTGYAAEKLMHTITGRDVAGDLVDCAAAPDGPAEFRNLTLTEICTRICRPYGITVTADVDVGARFPKFGLEAAEKAMPAIEKACRQRGVLAISDGVGGLRLTRGGRGTGPAPLVFGDNIYTLDATLDHSERHSRYIVKGQSRGTRPAALDGNANPLTAAPPERRPAARSPAGARPSVVMTGEARDPAVTRHRPTVSMSKTQSGGASVQEQADWRMRTHRAKAESLRATVPGWRAGKEQRLWRPNERIEVDDPLSNASAELLISSLVYRRNEREGDVTEMKLRGPEAFDVLREGEKQRGRGRGRRRGSGQGRGDNTARNLTADAPPRAGR